MKKIVILKLLIFFVSALLAQDKYDVRKTKWGMTQSEVISSEYPISPVRITDNIIYNSNNLKFENIELTNGQTADIYYRFTNGKLIEIRYCIFGYKYADSKGTCNNIIPFIKKVNSTSSIINGLLKKGFHYDNYGWYFSHPPLVIRTNEGKYYSSDLNTQTLTEIQKVAIEKKFCKICIGLEKERTNVELSYNEYQNCKTSLEENKLLKMLCNDDFYNIYCWLHFYPNNKVLKELTNDDF